MNLRAHLPDIEAAAVRGWPALETAPFNGWLWRHSSGGSTRANSVAALAFTGHDPVTAIAAVEAHCQARHLAVCFTVSDVSLPTGLDAHLEARGYARGDSCVTMAKNVDATTALPVDVEVATQPTVQWMTVYLSGLSENRRAAAPHIIERLPTGAMFISASTDGQVTSSGLTVGDGSVASVQCMATLQAAQRRGGAQRVLQTIEHLAARDGRRALYLQTGEDNVAARSLYARAGYYEIGRYHTRTLVFEQPRK